MKRAKIGFRAGLGFTVASFLGSACVPPGDSEVTGRLGVEVAEVEESSPTALLFEEAAARWDVPVDLLKALAYAETGLEPAVGEVEFEGQEQPFGLLALRGTELERAAALAGYTPERVMGDDAANVDAAAALLDAYARAVGLDDALRKEPGVWKPALERWGGIDDVDHRREFAEGVLAHLARGLAVPMLDGTTLVIGRDPRVERELPEGLGTSEAGLRASGTVWRPSPNFNGRGGSDVDLVVIHTCEGGYSGCVGWLRNPQARASAHYVVNESGSETAALVDESNRAWHVAASYRPGLNGDRLGARSGQSTNTFSVGIEHAGRASQSRWPAGQIDASVRLVRDITARHGIPRDRYHVVAHGRLQPESRSDPGANWPWSSYLAEIAGGASTPPPPAPAGNPPPPPAAGGAQVITVDNGSAGRFRASGAWESSSWAAGRVGSDYRFRVAEETSDLAEYRVPLADAGRYEVFARVPGNGYSSEQPYIIHHRGGRSVVRRNIRAAGASWVSLGTYDFDAGDDWIVQISCWTGARGYIIADAIRLERR